MFDSSYDFVDFYLSNAAMNPFFLDEASPRICPKQEMLSERHHTEVPAIFALLSIGKRCELQVAATLRVDSVL